MNLKNDRARPYMGQAHTSFGERGKVQVKGLTFRDIVDCFVKGLLQSSYPNPAYDKVKDGAWGHNDIYKIDLKEIDPGAVHQNMCCEIEKMMGIFPNVPQLEKGGVK